MNMTDERKRIGARFAAAEDYDTAARVQRLTARRLLDRIAERLGDRAPRQILEFGCGTGFLTALLRERWPNAQIVATDIAPAMLARAARRCGEAVRFAQMDAAHPTVEGGPFDLVCGNLALQWIAPLESALTALGRKLAPGGVLAASTLASGSFVEWQIAHAQEGQEAGIRTYPTLKSLQDMGSSAGLPAHGRWESEIIVEQTGSGLGFLRALRQTGATTPRPGSRPLTPGALARVLRQFDAGGAALSWEVAYGVFQTPPRAGVFVTGTDTGVGKTLVSACLTRAWNALYWKPLQTGLAEEEGDTPTVAHLADASSERIVPPAATFLAPLSPDAAASAEGREVDTDRLVLPMQEPDRPLVVEGAGGLLVPVTAVRDGKPGMMMIDLIASFGLPVILVARSGLGTLNHTLLSLEALRTRGLTVAGVVLNGPLNAGNRQAIESHGGVRVLAELPPLDAVTPDSVTEVAGLLPAWDQM